MEGACLVDAIAMEFALVDLGKCLPSAVDLLMFGTVPA